MAKRLAEAGFERWHSITGMPTAFRASRMAIEVWP